MKSILYLFLISVVVFCVGVISLNNSVVVKPDLHNPQRIVSLAPAITETLFALGLGERIAGVTKFCLWPPEAMEKPKIGGFREINLESIARSKTDLVLLPGDMKHFKMAIEKLGLPVRIFNYSSLKDYLASVHDLGSLTGTTEKAEKLVAAFDAATSDSFAAHRPKVLFVLMNPGEFAGAMTDMTVIGADAFYNELIQAAGGINAYRGALPYPRLSLEAVINLKPDVIALGASGLVDCASMRKKLEEIVALCGIAINRVAVLNDPGDTIPGPRSLGTIKKLKAAISAEKDHLQ